MVIDVRNEAVFIPEWHGNRELPESEQIQVVHRFLTPGEKQKYYYTEPIELSGEKPKTHYVQNLPGHVRAVVIKIEGLTLNIDGKEKKVTTGNDLYSVAGVPYVLVAEIERYMMNVEPEVDTSFLPGRSS
jgi:hypothetical protein